jgi:hypothetical protein
VAKSSKDRDRRAIVEEMRKKQQQQERRRTLMVLLACLVVGGLIIGFAAVKYLDQRRRENRDLSDIGASKAAAACQPIKTKKVDLTVQKDGTYHVPVGSKVDYPDAPPAFGLHWGNFLAGSEMKNLYLASDRPEVERLVHSLEHGYSILWYDQTIGDDDAVMKDVQAIADKYPVGDYLIIAPWEKEDGAAFPDKAHVALTHWRGNQEGVWEYCGKVSGPVVQKFTKDYPKSDSPEPNAQ